MEFDFPESHPQIVREVPATADEESLHMFTDLGLLVQDIFASCRRSWGPRGHLDMDVINPLPLK